MVLNDASTVLNGVGMVLNAGGTDLIWCLQRLK
jgi:hypothetical protein